MILSPATTRRGLRSVGSTERISFIVAEIISWDGGCTVADPHGLDTPCSPSDLQGGEACFLEVSLEVSTSADDVCCDASASAVGNEASIESSISCTDGEIGTAEAYWWGRQLSITHVFEPQKGKIIAVSSQQEGEHPHGGGAQNGWPSYCGKATVTENINNRADGGAVSFVLPHRSIVGHGTTVHIPVFGWHDPGVSELGKITSTYEMDRSDRPSTPVDGREVSSCSHRQSMGSFAPSFKPGPHEGYSNVHNCDHRMESEDGTFPEDGKCHMESQKDNGGTRESSNGETDNHQPLVCVATD